MLSADVLWRTRYTEGRLAQAVQRGIRQARRTAAADVPPGAAVVVATVAPFIDVLF